MRNIFLNHWNLNSLDTHDFAKGSALKVFNAIEEFDFICLSKSYLGSPFCPIIAVSFPRWLKTDPM